MDFKQILSGIGVVVVLGLLGRGPFGHQLSISKQLPEGAIESFRGEEDDTHLTLYKDRLVWVGAGYKEDMVLLSEIAKVNTYGPKFLIRLKDGDALEFTILPPILAKSFEEKIEMYRRN